MVNRAKLRVGNSFSSEPLTNRTFSISATYLRFNPLWKGNLLTSWIQVVSKNPTGVDGASKGFSQHMSRKVFGVANICYSKANLDDVAGRFLPYMNTEFK